VSVRAAIKAMPKIEFLFFMSMILVNELISNYITSIKAEYFRFGCKITHFSIYRAQVRPDKINIPRSRAPIRPPRRLLISPRRPQEMAGEAIAYAKKVYFRATGRFALK
jgi:hypothetical protein